MVALTGCPGNGGDGDAGPTPDVPGADVPGGGTDSGRDAPIPLTVPIFRNEVTTPDADLAMAALRILGAPEAGATANVCNDCHSLNRAQMRYWSALTVNGMECIPDVTLAGGDADAAAVVECFRGGDSRYNTHDFGVIATAADLPWFQYTFAHGGPAGEHDVLLSQAAMPRGMPAFTQEQFDTVVEWFLRGAPNVDDILPAETLPTTCEPDVTDSLVDYLNERATNSWATVNAANGMLMYGCAGASDALGCLADETLSSSTGYGADWDDISSDGVAGMTSRVLYTTSYSSSYWTRSSADGRWVSHGAGGRLAFRFIDLADGGSGAGTAGVIAAAADYDPFFFPDDSGFVSQSGGRGPRICPMSVLTTGSPTEITFNEEGCTGGAGIGLYQHLGAALDGSDYWAIDSVSAGTMSATYDNGGHERTNDNPSVATFSSSGARSQVRFFVNTGTTFEPVSASRINHPYEGDAVISHSTGLVLTRQAGASGQLGFSTHLLESIGTGAERELVMTLGGRYCTLPGGKPGFSFDERFFVYHHYIENTDADAMALGFTGTDDAGFAPYRTQGGGNIYLVDQATGDAYRITNMAPGQYAFSPHFRSDGWIYYMVRTAGTNSEYVVANDAALRIAPL